jgi:hypothetical protein
VPRRIALILALTTIPTAIPTAILAADSTRYSVIFGGQNAGPCARKQFARP